MVKCLYICCTCIYGPDIYNDDSRCFLCLHLLCDNCTFLNPPVEESVSHTGRTKTPGVVSINQGDNGQGQRSCKVFREISYTTTRRIRKFCHEDELCDLDISLTLDLRGFVKRELGGSTDLESLVVVSGSLDDEGDRAFATTCEEYIAMFWGNEGVAFVRNLVAVYLGMERGESVMRHMDVGYSFSNTSGPGQRQILYVCGLPKHLELLLQLLAWLHCVIQSPNCNELGLADVFVSLERERRSRWNDPSRPKFSCFFKPKQGTLGVTKWDEGRHETVNRHQTDESGTQQSDPCWPPLFGGAVMANGFPVPSRGDEKGVELSFDIMVTLGRISHTLELPHGTILKGQSTMLIPTAGSKPDSVQWHFVTSETPGEYLSPKCVPDDLKPHILEMDLNQLRAKRAFVGYCNTAWVSIGTRGSQFEQVDLSTAPRERTVVCLGREITPTMGSSGIGIFGAGAAAKVKFSKRMYLPVTEEELCLEDRMRNSRDNPLLLYEVENKTGFMVPELCAVLAIAHVWASRQADRDDLLNKIPFAQLSPNGGQAAYDSIFADKTLKLREAFADQKELFLMTKLSQIFLSLEKRKEQQRIFNEDSIPILRSPYLCGWELFEIAACQPSYHKRVKLAMPKDESWHRIARDNQDVLVLFYAGLADAIQLTAGSVCPVWSPLPAKKEYLLASVHCVQALSRLNGGNHHSTPKVTSRLALLPDYNGDRFGKCDLQCQGKCNRVQELGKKKNGPSVPLPNDGAILLGPRCCGG